MRVAVIGAGACGLTAIKCCKEGGLDVVCYERSGDIGGLWRYRESDEEGLASVTKSTVINTSKEITSYSDFPPPKEFPNYMHNSMMFRYLKLYAEHFDLIPHIAFRHRVESVVPAENYESSGRWKITTLDLKTNECLCQVVDAVMICTGHHVFPNMPTFPGQEKFKGTVTHTHSYKKAAEFEDKKVVVVGAGNSAGDAAVEVSRVASRVYLSTRRGCWVLQRVAENGKPYDNTLITRFNSILFRLAPLSLSCYFVERELNKKFDHETYQLKPKHRFFQQHPMINDALPNRILSGTITVKGNIRRFEENGIVFEGDSEVTEVDHVILATGYEIKFPFLDTNVIDTTDNRVELYKYVFPPNNKHPTLSVIGLFQALGGAFPIFELQSRWVVQVLLKNQSLPSETDMRADVERKLGGLRQRYYNSKRHTIQVDYVDYSDEIASLIGAKLDFLQLFFLDPLLFWALMTGPSLPYQYRLRGPHPWKKARETILDYHNRFSSPLQTRYKKPETLKTQWFFVYLVFIAISVAFLCSAVFSH